MISVDLLLITMKNTNDEFNLDPENVQNTRYQISILKMKTRHSGKFKLFSRQMQSNCRKDKAGREERGEQCEHVIPIINMQ